MKGLTWLHISDWHQWSNELDRKIVRDALLEDIKYRTNISPDLTVIDFVVFSGDLAFSGRSEEYQAATRELLDPLLEVCGDYHDHPLIREKLFIIPGNHDLDRTILEELPVELKMPLEFEAQLHWMEDIVKKTQLLKPFDLKNSRILWVITPVKIIQIMQVLENGTSVAKA